MTSYKHQYDVIGPICSGYVPFCPVVTDCATAISCVEVARLEEGHKLVPLKFIMTGKRSMY